MNMSPSEIEQGAELYAALADVLERESAAKAAFDREPTGAAIAEKETAAAAVKEARQSYQAFYARQLEKQLQPQQNGDIVVELSSPVTFEGTEVSKVTVRAIRVRDVKRAKLSYGPEGETILEVIAEPSGIAEELASERDHEACLMAAGKQMGKYRRAGWPSLP